ncbi:MAG: hypothetical protein HZB53_10650 [Chloroflexi bacterium]|nr:hypothetical protein [Chloroflexota bacterium]
MKRKRIPAAVSAALFGLTVMTVSIAYAQGGGFLPDQSVLYDDAATLARLVPAVLAISMLVGIFFGRRSTARRPEPVGETVVRHDVGGVMSHWVNTVGFVIGMITGAIALRWISRPDDMRLVWQLHFVGSGLVVFAVGSHIAENVIAGGFGLLPRSFKDVLHGLGETLEYAGIWGPDGAVFHLPLPKAIRQPLAETFESFGVNPPKRTGKYLSAEKVLSYTPWAIIVGVMLVTGSVKVFRYIMPIAPDLVAQMSKLHDIFTIVAIVMLGIHLSALFLVPRHWPLVVSMFTTRISTRYVEKYHSLWLNDLKTAAQQAEPAQSAQAKPAEGKARA